MVLHNSVQSNVTFAMLHRDEVEIRHSGNFVPPSPTVAPVTFSTAVSPTTPFYTTVTPFASHRRVARCSAIANSFSLQQNYLNCTEWLLRAVLGVTPWVAAMCNVAYLTLIAARKRGRRRRPLTGRRGTRGRRARRRSSRWITGEVFGGQPLSKEDPKPD